MLPPGHFPGGSGRRCQLLCQVGWGSAGLLKGVSKEKYVNNP